MGTDDEMHSQPITPPGYPCLISALRVGLGKQIIITLTLNLIPAIAYLYSLGLAQNFHSFPLSIAANSFQNGTD